MQSHATPVRHQKKLKTQRFIVCLADTCPSHDHSDAKSCHYESTHNQRLIVSLADKCLLHDHIYAILYHLDSRTQ